MPGMAAVSRCTALPLALAIAMAAPTFSQFAAPEPSPLPSGDATIRGNLGDSEIVIQTTSRLAGAIHSLTWNGQEFIDSFDHGRQLQSASNFDAGGKFVPETFNPTEAGSMSDGRGNTSTSRLLHLIAQKNRLQTTTQMAFWLRLGEKSLGSPARNTEPLSNHLLSKRVTIGYRDLPNVIVYDVTFSLPLGESHKYAQFEAVTGYMPPEFSRFWKFNSESEELEKLSDGPGEQPHPVVLATEDGKYAMGVYSPKSKVDGMAGPGYGRFRFEAEKVVKWNSVFRLRSETSVPAADYSFRNFVVVGDLKMVAASLQKLTAE